ncbi:MAG: N-acetyltransferase, partial [Balneolaceae bacterium]
ELFDLNLLEQIEQKSLPFYQQSSRHILQRSLKSNFQQAWIACVNEEKKVAPAGLLILYLHKKSIRIFSIAVMPEYQGKGVGVSLLNHARDIALKRNNTRISLEVNADNRRLVEWYKKAGFSSTELLKDYYEEGKDGLRMVEMLAVNTH